MWLSPRRRGRRRVRISTGRRRGRRPSGAFDARSPSGVGAAGSGPGRRRGAQGRPYGRDRPRPPHGRRPRASGGGGDDGLGSTEDGGGPPAQLWPSNRLVTEPSLNTSLIARASSGAIDSTVSLSKRFSCGIGSVLVMMISLILEFFSRSTAPPDSTPWVAVATTRAAPCSNRASAALAMVA